MSKFLSYEDRLIIAQCIQENVSFGKIEKEPERNRTTIAKEIKKYSCDKKCGRSRHPYNPCKLRASCKVKKSVVKDVLINQLINVTYALNVIYDTLISKRISVL